MSWIDAWGFLKGFTPPLCAFLIGCLIRCMREKERLKVRCAIANERIKQIAESMKD